MLEGHLEASGADLKDLFFLTGVSLVNTGRYRIDGNYFRQGTQTRFNDLHLITGQSDVTGKVTIDSASGRPKAQATVFAQNLRLADFGLRAAGREVVPSPPVQMLLSNTAFNPAAVRRGDAVVDFAAGRVVIGSQVLQDVAAKLAIDRGMILARPLTANILGGQLSGTVKVDATNPNDPPVADLDLSIANLQLAQMPHESADPPLEGAMSVRLKLTGRGSSVHQVAASAQGSMTALLPRGTVRASLAELAGIDLRGLGLTLEKSSRAVPVRCAAANFIVHAGVFSVQRMVFDTEPVLITGEGSIHMDGETLELVLRGEPKSLRLLRLRAPLMIRGTLAHALIGIEKGDSKLLLVDRGRAKDVDCSALVQ